jgi:hypothetical protein
VQLENRTGDPGRIICLSGGKVPSDGMPVCRGRSGKATELGPSTQLSVSRTGQRRHGISEGYLKCQQLFQVASRQRRAS